jgi:hypothetical protein
MLGDMHIEITLPAIPGAHAKDRWKPYLPYILFRRIKIWMDEVLVLDQERVWSFIHDALFVSSGHLEGYRKMIGFDQNLSLTQQHTLLIPVLAPWSTKRFLPMVSLFNTKLYMDIELERFDACVDLFPGRVPTARYVAGGQIMTFSGTIVASDDIVLESVRPPPDLPASLVMQCVYIEPPERHTFLGKRIGYPIEFVLDTETLFTKTNRVVKIDLRDLSEPCKVLYWVVYESGNQSFGFVESPFSQATISLGSQVLMRQSIREYSIPNIRSDQPSISILPLNTLFPANQFLEGSMDFGKSNQPASLVFTVNSNAFEADKEYMLKIFTITKRLLFFRNGRATV